MILLIQFIPMLWPIYDDTTVLVTFRAFQWYPICQAPLDQSGSGSGLATIIVTWIAICFTVYSNKCKYCLQTTDFSVFIAFFSYLSTNTTGIATTTTVAAAGRKGPLAPHMRPCPPCWRIEWMGDNPPSKRVWFIGLLRVCTALKVLHCSGNERGDWGAGRRCECIAALSNYWPCIVRTCCSHQDGVCMGIMPSWPVDSPQCGTGRVLI